MPGTPLPPSTKATPDPRSLRVIVSTDGATIRNATVEEGAAAPALDWRPSDAVVKLVIGDPPRRGQRPEKVIELATPLPADLAACSPNLRECFLWAVAGIRSITSLPKGLRTLDIRGCPDLRTLPRLPEGLETLILEGCPALRIGVKENGAPLHELEELSVRDSPEIQWPWIEAVLAGAPKLWSFDASQCPAITQITAWPANSSLEEIRLQECPNLTALPKAWPPRLRRLELSGSTALATLPDDFGATDFINLNGMTALRTLPPIRRVRTLYLFGSGVASPPRTLHGDNAESNVADSVRGFFRDVALSGPGVARRAKLLLLGNGKAGKTSLSLSLQPDADGRSANDLGSTHGVRFCEWRAERSPRPDARDAAASPASAHDPARAQDLIPVHIWDFGGQEIYHAQHRHFANSGTVFIIVWEPANGPSTGNDPDTREQLRTLPYWFNFILRGRTEPPRIAVVRSKCAQADDKARETYQAKAREEYQAIIERLKDAWATAETVGTRAKEFAAALEKAPLYFIDSPDQGLPSGEIDALREWLEESVAAEAEASGGSVSKLWEIAAAMLDRWLDRMGSAPDFFAAHNQMLPDRFEAKLRNELEERIAAWRRERHAPGRVTRASDRALEEVGADGRFADASRAPATGDEARRASMEKLADSLERGELLLDDDRIERLLDFLSRSGWIYWSRHLAGKRLIVDQAWAIKGIYRLLDHRETSKGPSGQPFSEWLAGAEGRVTPKELNQFVWSGSFNPDEQALMISMMEDLGVCFRLGRSDRGRSEPDSDAKLVVCAYLPTRMDSDRATRLQRDRERYEAHLDGKPGFEDAEWVGLLRLFGRTFGERASYARLGVLHFPGPRGILVLVDPPDAELGTKGQRYRILIVGHDDEDEARDLLEDVAAALGVPGPPRREGGAAPDDGGAERPPASSRRVARRERSRARAAGGGPAFSGRDADSEPLVWFFEARK